jgi:glutamine synthetase
MDREAIRKEFEERGIKRVKVGGFDVDGLLRGKYISLDKLWGSLDKGFGFCDVIFGWDVGDQLYDNAKVTGWHSGYPDALGRIDPTSLRFLPSEPETAHFLVDFWEAKDKPHAACPRNLLKRVTARAEAAGYKPTFGVEFEFWLFKEQTDTLQQKGFHNLEPISPGMFGYSWVRQGQFSELLEALYDELVGYGIDIEALHTETGPGVYEVAIKHADPVLAADMAGLFKSTMKILCAKHGLSVTFMAKWNARMPGSSGHLHQSLWDSTGTTNLFADPAAPYGLSKIGQHYVGGLMELSPELTALIAPTINSYKRYVPGMWAPMCASWGVENRTCSIRVINQPGASSTRAEFRQSAADINPHIAIATCLGMGLYGIEHALPLPPPDAGDATKAGGPRALPHTLALAVEALRNSKRAGEVLTDAFVDHYVRSREWEVREYQKAVTDWELARYFEAI